MSIVRPLFLVAATAVVGLSSEPVPRSVERELDAQARSAHVRVAGARSISSLASSSAAHPWRARCARSEFAGGTPKRSAELEPRSSDEGERAAQGVGDDERTSSAPTAGDDERAARFAPHGSAASSAMADELLNALRTARQPGLRALADAGEPFLELLPLDALRDVRCTERELVLSFDTGLEDALVVTIPGRTEQVLDADEDDPDPLRHGRAVALRSEEHRLRIGRELRFRLDAHGIAGVRAGDLEVVKGPFHVDLDLRTELRAGEAHDRYGRPVLATDAEGHALRVDGRWQVESHATWIVLEALGHRVEVGL